jgi:tetratricopeptide (TPR) repeat protein
METSLKVPLEVRKQCVSLALQQISRIPPTSKPQKENGSDERINALTTFLRALPEILSPAERNQKQVRAFFEEIYRDTRKSKSLSSLTYLMPISNALGLQREPEIAADMVICLSKTKSPDEDGVEFPHGQLAVENLVEYGFARETIDMIEQMPTGSPKTLRYKQELQSSLLRPHRDFMGMHHVALPHLKAAMNEVIAYIQQLPETERTPLLQSLGWTTRRMGQHQLANTIFEEIAQAAIKEKDAMMLFNAAQWRFRNPSQEETILVPLDITWRDRVQAALAWESSKDATDDVGRAFVGCGAWQDALEYTQKNYIWGVRHECITMIYSMGSPLIQVAKAFWERGQKTEALQIYKVVRALPIPERDMSDNQALAEMAALCDTPATALHFANRSDSYVIYGTIIELLVKRGNIGEIVGATQHLKKSFKRLRQYNALIPLVRQHPSLNSALLSERKRLREFDERAQLASLLAQNGQQKEARECVNRLHQELRKRLVVNSITKETFYDLPGLAQALFLVGDTVTNAELLRYAQSRARYVQIDKEMEEVVKDCSEEYAYRDIVKEQTRAGLWQDAIETTQKFEGSTDKMEAILSIAKGNVSEIWL